VTATIRGRLDKISLRWQARLDSEWADRTVPWLAAGTLFALLAGLSLARARSLDDGIDLAAYRQAAWMISRHLDPRVTLLAGGHLLSQQAAFGFYPIAWLTRLAPTIPTLLVVQSAALALGVVPLWLLARNVAKLRVGAAAALLWAYSFYPALHSVNLSDFHPEALALPALLFAFYYGLEGRWVPYTTAAVVTVLMRADLALAVAGIGILLLLEGRRRAGIASIVIGLGYVILAVFVLQPAFGNGSYAHAAAFATYGKTPASIAGGMLTHPLQVVRDLTVEDNFSVIVFLLAPVFFLPVVAPRYLLGIVPLEVLYLVGSVPIATTFGQQTIAATAFVFLATTFALRRIGRQGVERITVDHRVLWALVLVSTVFFIRDAPSSPYRQPWSWGGRDVADAARLAAVDAVHPDQSVRASPDLVPLLAQRTQIYALPTGTRPDVRLAIALGNHSVGDHLSRAGRVDVIILDAASVPDWSENELRVFREGLERSGYRRRSSVEGVEVFESTRR
jgi:uncharacterized membrane protein